MKPVLAFDCSTPHASVAVQAGERMVTRQLAQGEQAAMLVPTIDALLEEAGVSYGELGCIVTTVGPGSFTGLRIALATLHGLAQATSATIKTLTASEAIARTLGLPVCLVALHAGKGEIFMQRFQGSESASPIELIHPEALPCDLPVYGNILPPEDPHYVSGPHAEALCRMADALPETGIANALPLYIRPPDAKPPAPLPWLQTP